MKCLVIHGSPRRGNTWDVLNLAKEEMKRNGEVEFIDVELSKEEIPNCIGCFNCIFKGEENCPHSKIMSNILFEMENMDAIIITSPVYSMQVTGLMKTFIDHMSYNFHRPKYFTKKALVITTTAGAGHKNTANYIKSVLEYWGLNYIQTLPIAYRNMELTEKNKIKIKNESKKFMLDLKSNKLHSPTIKSVAMFNAWKGMSTTKYTFGNADYDYWTNTGLINYTFHPLIPISKGKRILGSVIYKMMKKC